MKVNLKNEKLDTQYFFESEAHPKKIELPTRNYVQKQNLQLHNQPIDHFSHCLKEFNLV